MESNVILRHCYLRRDFDYLFAQVVHVCDFVNERNLEVYPWLQSAVELLEPVNQSRELLADDDDEAEVPNSTAHTTTGFSSFTETPSLLNREELGELRCIVTKQASLHLLLQHLVLHYN